jgi:phage-related tail fiber protein
MSFNCLITTLGQAKIAAAIAAGTQISATHIAVGDGNGNATIPSVGQSSLVREVYRTNVSSVMVNPQDSSQVIFEAVISASVGGWTARELGLFDNAGVLIAVANIGSVYKPLATEGSAREMVVRIYAQVNQVGAINLVVDPSFFIATRSWVQSNYSLAALIPGGTTGQILRKKSNASGDTEWANPLSAQNVTVDVVTEIQTLASGQTVVTLATANTTGTAIYVEGIRLRPNQYTINSVTQFTLAQSYPANSKLLAVQNDPNASLDFAKKTLNLSDLSSASSARANLGLGTIATAAAADYLTVAAGLAKAGGTMTGPIVLAANPTAALQAAPKQYVDGTLVTSANGYTRLPSGLIIQWVTGASMLAEGTQTIVFPITFPTSCLQTIVSTRAADIYVNDNMIQEISSTTSTVVVRYQLFGGAAAYALTPRIISIGY